VLKLRLRPANIGYFEKLSNTYMTLSNLECIVPDGANLSGLKESYKRESGCPFEVIEGSLEDNEEEKVIAPGIIPEVVTDVTPAIAAEIIKEKAEEAPAPIPTPKKKRTTKKKVVDS
jgi:hypothetical protein